MTLKNLSESNLPLVDANQIYRGCPRGVMIKRLDCGIGVNEFEVQSC